MALSGRIDAIVLAGGPRDAVAALAPNAPNKAFVPIAGKALVTRTLDALRAAPSIARITVVAPRETHLRPELAGADELRDAGRTMGESLCSGLRGAPANDLILVCASDLPVLSAVALEEFIALAIERSADLCYACVERRTHVARYKDVPHTWAHLRDGTYCGAGSVALRPRVLPALSGLLGRLGAARKNPLRLASIFGTDVLLRYALRRLTIARAEQRATQLLGASVGAIVCTHPEIAVNVDRPSDVALANLLLA